jgi:ABC-type multidrug transport system ATPase subunit
MYKIPIYILTVELSAISAHSMEEAEALCDRVGIFVNGELQCIGNAKEVIHLLFFTSVLQNLL